MNIKRSGTTSLRFCLLIALVSCVPRVGHAQIPELVVQTGHAVSVRTLAFSPDGKILASGGSDRSIIVWDVLTGRQLRTLVGHEDAVSALAFTADGSLLSASWDGTVRRWDPHSSSEPAVVIDAKEAIVSMVPGASGSKIAVSGFDNRVMIWDVRDGARLLTTVEGIPRGGSEGAVVLVRDDTLTVVVDVDTQRELYVLETILGPGPVAMSVARRLAAHAGEWPNVDLVDLGDDNASRALSGFGVAALSFDAAGSRLAVAAANGHVFFYNTERGDTLWTASICDDDRNGCWAQSLDLSNDGSMVAVGFRKGEVVLLDASTGEQLNSLAPTTSLVRSVSFGPSSSLLASVADDGFLRLFDFRQLSEQRPIARYEEGTVDVAIRPGGSDIVVGTGSIYRRSGRRFWSVERQAEVGPAGSNETNDSGSVVQSVYSPDGKLVAGIMDGFVYVSPADSTQAVRLLTVPGPPIQRLAFLPAGDEIATVNASGSIDVTKLKTGVSRHIGAIDTTLTGGWLRVNDLAVSPTGQLLAMGSSVPMVWSLVERRLAWVAQSIPDYTATVAFDPTGAELASSGSDGVVHIWDASTGRAIQELRRHSTWVSDVEYSPDGRFLVSASGDTSIRYWRRTSGGNGGPFEPAATLIGFRDGSWVVVDEEGRFDGSNGGDVDGLHWVVGDEVVALGQLKDRYYDPGLMQKIVGAYDEPLRDVAGLREDKLELWPDVTVSEPDANDGKLVIGITERGGGVGRVVVRINGKEAVADARQRNADPSAGGGISVDVADSPFLLPGVENEIEVIVYNKDGYLHSRGVKKPYTPRAAEELPPISLWALVVGVSDYSGTDLDLVYAARDAKDFANALGVGADKLFDGRFHLSLLTSDPDTPSASRENVLAALEEMRQASPVDVIVAYFAGHGIVYGGPKGDFHYLTQDAATGDISDPVVRRSTTISGNELNGLLGQIPALKQALILDTCHSGGIVASLAAGRSLPPSRRLALERMKDRNSVFVLAGSAADAVSYEASRYGQGLLTYSLLMGMKGASLRDGEFVDVARLFDFARDNVPSLARGIGGIQDPVVAVPRGGSSFDIGELSVADREKIPLSTERPLILRASFQDRDLFDDHLALTRSVNEALRAAARGTEPTVYYVDAADFQDGYRVAGQYTVTDGRVDVIARIFLGRLEVVGEVSLSGLQDDVALLAQRIVSGVSERLESTWYGR